MLYIIGFLLVILVVFLGFKYFAMRTLLKNKNNELEALNTKIKITSQKNEEFISSLSHELRTPLYGIMGLTNLLIDEYPQLQESKNFTSLKFTGDYLLTLINNILQVNYVDSNEVSSTHTQFDLKEITQNIVNSFRYATESSNNTLTYTYDDDIPRVLVGNPAILSQILMNLISNALRFTKNGNVLFSIRLIKKKNTGNTISFNIEHDGNEISQEDEKSIYQEFINIEKVKNTYLGTGLNATIVRKLAESIHGEIILQNDTNIGSEYVFLIDLQSVDQQQKIETVTSQKKKVLVVDDNKLNLLVADRILSKENYECTVLDNGFDAIETVRDNTFDIILMDINMPKLNGIGTTKRIRQFDTEIPIIALTAVDVTQLNRQIIKAGINNYILKPYDKKFLLEMIRKYI